MTNIQKTILSLLVLFVIVSAGALFAVNFLSPVFQRTPEVVTFDQAAVAKIQDCLKQGDASMQGECEQLVKAITSYEQCVQAGFPITKNFPPTCALPDGRKFVDPSAPTPTPGASDVFSLSGNITCLPTKEVAADPSIEPCVFGLKETDDSYYAIDTTELAPTALTQFKSEDTVQIEGTVVVADTLSSAHWQKYNIKGIIQAKTLRIL